MMEILKNADLASTTSKSVIKKLEKKLGSDLSDKKKLIDRLVMDYVNSKESESEEEEEEKSEEEAKADDDEEEYGTRAKRKKPEPKKKGKAKSEKGGGGGGRAKGSGYTRAYKLSPALAEVMGQDEMPRHEVVKRMWAIIKERQLYDPSNKRFAICDKQLYKVFGTKRFQAFGMMKYLKTHFLD
ncbi:hypothetical protein K1T71_013460 [Dendrolimus kikuchii]|uniref:Uncharacterized protein n=1 Tax=Dendrolimus kikuchii TaxID=765133 RepID=A0ACC1CGI0_9NEOP|nr:hypothetical protein K1T71_013460 [Dendrolimus kikuchii]